MYMIILENIGGSDRRSLVDRDQDTTRYIARMGRTYGYSMSYVGDYPELYGLEISPLKRDGGTQTTWVMMTATA